MDKHTPGIGLHQPTFCLATEIQRAVIHQNQGPCRKVVVCLTPVAFMFASGHALPQEAGNPLSGPDFEAAAGRGTSKTWRTSIRVMGQHVGARLKQVGEWLEEHTQLLVRIHVHVRVRAQHAGVCVPMLRCTRAGLCIMCISALQARCSRSQAHLRTTCRMLQAGTSCAGCCKQERPVQGVASRNVLCTECFRRKVRSIGSSACVVLAR